MVIIVFISACSNNSSSEPVHQHDSTKTVKDNKKSIPSEARLGIDDTEIRIKYHSPAVRGRVIWGGLVPYDTVWVTGAHSATTFETGKDFKMGGKLIPAGKYALFTIPGKEEWIIILNKNWDQHLTDDYSETEDIVRIKAKPLSTNESTERLNYSIIEKDGQMAEIIISWEKLRVPFAIEVSK